MTELQGFVLHGAPRTKKNSQRFIAIPKKGGHRCASCGHMPGFPKVLPSEAYEEWERAALVECMAIKAKLRAMGVELPILGLVSVEAHIYRERDTGDVCGYQQAIGDLLQAAEIIKDDRQIEDWDGTRRLKDAAAPRVEVFIRVLSEVPAQGELL